MNALFKPASYQKGTVFAVSATLVWKLISFANALLIAAYFGATYQTDIYFYLTLVVGFGLGFTQRLNQTVLIPEAMFLHAKHPARARKFLTMWLYIYVLAGSVAGLTGTAFAVPGGELISRFSAAELTSQHTLLILAVWWFALQLVTYYLQAVAEMFKYFAAAWLGILNALLPLGFLLLSGHQLGLASMLYGFVTANIVQVIILLALCRKQLGWSFRPEWVALSKRVRKNILAGQSLAVLDMVNGLLPLYLMSGMNAGIVSALTYCRQLTDSATEVWTARAANIVKIELTEYAARRQAEQFNHHFLQATRLLVAVLAPLAVFSAWFAPQIVELFFERGQFTSEAARQTVLFLRPMLFVMLLTAPGTVQNSALSAARKIKESFPYALAAGVFLTGLIWAALPHWGAFTYPYVLLTGYGVGFAINTFLFKKQFPYVQYAAHLGITLKLTLLATGALIPAAGLAYALPGNGWIQVFVCGPVFLAVYAGLFYLSGEWTKIKQLSGK